MSDPYTVGTLRAALAELPDDLLIILSKDEEGNGFKQLWDVSPSKCAVDDGDFDPIHPDDLAEYLEEYDVDDIVDVVVLWP